MLSSISYFCRFHNFWMHHLSCFWFFFRCTNIVGARKNTLNFFPIIHGFRKVSIGRTHSKLSLVSPLVLLSDHTLFISPKSTPFLSTQGNGAALAGDDDAARRSVEMVATRCLSLEAPHPSPGPGSGGRVARTVLPPTGPGALGWPCSPSRSELIDL